MPAPLRAIFFDAVGTLIHPEPSPVRTYRAVACRFGSVLSEAAIAGRFALAFRHEEQQDRESGNRTSEAREEERWQRIVASVLDDVNDPEACFAALWEHFSRPEAWRCEPGTGAVLHELAARGFALGLASNYDRRLRTVVAGMPDLRDVRHLVISSEVGWRKPAAPFFEAVRRAAGAEAEEILYVGDDPVNDFEGARGAGMRAVLFCPKEPASEQGRQRIESLRQLPGMVGRARQ